MIPVEAGAIPGAERPPGPLRPQRTGLAARGQRAAGVGDARQTRIRIFRASGYFGLPSLTGAFALLAVPSSETVHVVPSSESSDFIEYESGEATMV